MKKICIKWQKELFKDIEVDTEQPPLLMKSQLFTLTGVPPDRQKIMVPKAGLLKDDDWGKAELKDGMSLMMMGTAEKIPEPPPEEPKFIEDLPEDQQNAHELSRYGAGLVNLGNTCYMNSVLQCMYAVPELRQSLLQYGNRSSDPHVSAGTESRARLSAEAGRLFHQMNESGQPVPPVIFLALMKQIYPQFAQTGPKGAPKQQDAEECWTELMYTFRELVKDGSESIVAKLFAADTITKYKCEESGEQDEEREKLYSLKCNITAEVNHLHEGLALGLKADREKTSPALGRVVVFAGSAQLSSLPPYLCIHKVRFFYKQDVQQKAKILRKVSFPATLDLFDFCTEELRQELRGPRLALKALEDKDLGLGKARQGAGAAAGKDEKDAAEAGASKDPVEAQAAADPYAYAGKMTGRYTLLAVLTHKGRSADSGHYVGWAKQDDNKWVQFDDDEMLERKEEDILALSGGGDWHMAYILLYKCQRVAQKPAAAMDVEPAAEATPMET